MNWEIEHLSKRRIIRVTPSNVVDLNWCKQHAPTLKTAAETHNTNKFLYDYRNAQFRLSTMEIYNLSRMLETFGLAHHRQIAVVISATARENADFKFLADCYQNCGVSLKLFHEPEPALQWLAGTPPVKLASMSTGTQSEVLVSGFGRGL